VFAIPILALSTWFLQSLAIAGDYYVLVVLFIYFSFMVALWNRAEYYIFKLWFLSSFFLA